MNKEPSVFTKIINGEIPAYKIYEDDKIIAILDVHPVKEGHTLVIPKKQIDHLWDLDDEDYFYITSKAKEIAVHIRKIIQPQRVGVIVEGFGVPHAHIHLIPINEIDDLHTNQDFNSPINHDELSKIAEHLSI